MEDQVITERREAEKLAAENRRLREALEEKGKAQIYRDGYDAAIRDVESFKVRVSTPKPDRTNNAFEVMKELILDMLNRNRLEL